MTTQLVLLGTGTPNADPERFGSSLAIVVDDTPYLVDAGPGVVRRAAAAHQRGVTGLAVKRLNRLFLTHLHSDHTVGLPDLLLTPWVLEREQPLEIYGPAGTWPTTCWQPMSRIFTSDSVGWNRPTRPAARRL